MKINLKTLAKGAAKIAVPVLAAVVARRVLTGKFDLKAAAIDAARQALTDRAGA